MTARAVLLVPGRGHLPGIGPRRERGGVRAADRGRAARPAGASPEQLVSLATIRPNAPNGAEGGFSFPAFEEIERRQQVCTALIGYLGDGIFNVEANGMWGAQLVLRPSGSIPIGLTSKPLVPQGRHRDPK